MFIFLQIISCFSLKPPPVKRENDDFAVFFVFPDILFHFSNIIPTKKLFDLGIKVYEIPFSKYYLSSKDDLSEFSRNVVIARNDQFFELYKGDITEDAILEEIESASYSYVEVLTNETYNTVYDNSSCFFLLKNSEPIEEFDRIAFIYRNKKVRFAFFQDNSFSLQYIDNKNNASLLYDNSISMIHFVRNCKQLEKFRPTLTTFNFGPHSFHFLGITNEKVKEAEAIINHVNQTYSSFIDFDVVSWEDSKDIQRMCSISHNNLTFVMYNKLFNSRGYRKCLVFQDVELLSKELMHSYIHKAATYISNYNHKLNSQYYIFQDLMELNQNTFSNKVPDVRKNSFIFIYNEKSYSYFDANIIYTTVSKEFSYSNSLFYTMKYSYDNILVPCADSFPIFVLYRPNNAFPIIFNDILTMESFRNWVLKYDLENDQYHEDAQNDNEETNQAFNETETSQEETVEPNNLNENNDNNLNLEDSFQDFSSKLLESISNVLKSEIKISYENKNMVFFYGDDDGKSSKSDFASSLLEKLARSSQENSNIDSNSIDAENDIGQNENLGSEDKESSNNENETLESDDKELSITDNETLESSKDKNLASISINMEENDFTENNIDDDIVELEVSKYKIVKSKKSKNDDAQINADIAKIIQVEIEKALKDNEGAGSELAQDANANKENSGENAKINKKGGKISRKATTDDDVTTPQDIQRTRIEEL